MEGATIFKNSMVVFDQALASRLFNKGYFGSFLDGKLELSLEEALYLKEKKGLKLLNERGRILSTQSFMRIAERIQKRFSIRYRVFKDMRDGGYILKTAFKYGGDFRVYNKGDTPGKAHAMWILYAADEHESMRFLSFAAMSRVVHSVKKKLLIGIVDDEGSVTYYEMRWMKL
jgi:tRNA-intron endonuclease